MTLAKILADRQKADESEDDEARWRQAARDYVAAYAGTDAQTAEMVDELLARWQDRDDQAAPWLRDEYEQIRAALGKIMPAGDTKPDTKPAETQTASP